MQELNLESIFPGGIIQKLIDSGIHLGERIIICIIVYWIGKKLIRFINQLVTRFFNRKDYDPTVGTFLQSLINISLTAVLIISLINILGINNSSFVALLASAGVAIGMALSGTLQNFAGGAMILLFKPFRVGDYIEVQNGSGTVREIQIFNTILTTSDNRTIFIPNGGLSTGVIMNYSNQINRRIELIIGIGYGEDYDKAKACIEQIIREDSRILPSPEPFIALHCLNQSSVDIIIRVWTHKDEFWNVYFNLNEKIYKTFAEKNIDIPFPQMTVHLADNPK